MYMLWYIGMSGRLLRRLPLQAFSTLLQHRHIYTPTDHNNSTSSSTVTGTTDNSTAVSLSAYLLALRDTIISLKSTPCSSQKPTSTSTSHSPTPLPTLRTDTTDHTDSSWVDIPTLNLPHKGQNYDPAFPPKHSSSGGNDKMRCESPIMSNITDYTSSYPAAVTEGNDEAEEVDAADVHPTANTTTTTAYPMDTTVKRTSGVSADDVGGCEVGYWERHHTTNTTHAHRTTNNTYTATSDIDTKMNCDEPTTSNTAHNNDDNATITSNQPSLSSTLFSALPHLPRLPPLHTPQDAPTTTRATATTTTANGLHIPGIQAPKKEVINLTTSYPPTAPVSLCKTFKEFKIQLTSSTTTSTTTNTTNTTTANTTNADMTTPTDRYTGNRVRHNKVMPTTTGNTANNTNNTAM